MKKICFLIFIICSTITAYGQTQINRVRLKWDENTEKTIRMSQLFPIDSNSYFVYSEQMYSHSARAISGGGGKKFAISKIGKDGGLIETKQLSSLDYCNMCDAGWIIDLNGDVYLTFVPINKKKPVLVRKVDTRELEIDISQKPIELPAVGKSYSITYMTSESGLSYLNAVSTNTEKNTCEITLQLYDEQLKVVSDKTKSFPYVDGEFVSSDIDDQGNAYIVVSFKQESKKSLNLVRKLLVIRPDNNAIEVIDIEESFERRIKDMLIKAIPGQEGINIFGQYYDKAFLAPDKDKFVIYQNSKVTGKVTFQFNNEDGFSDKKYMQFPKSLSRSNPPRKGKKPKRIDLGISSISINEIEEMENGDVAELSEVVVEAGGGKYGIVYLLQKIVLTVYSPDGEIKWIKAIDRNHKVKDWITPSQIVVQGDKIGLFYVDGKMTFLQYYDAETGDKIRKKTINEVGKGNKLHVNLGMITKLNNHTLLLNRSWGKKRQSGILTIE